MSEVYRPSANLLMGPITGVRPTDGRWGGEICEEYIMAIYDDVMNSDMPMLVEKLPDDATPSEMMGMVVIQTIVRTGQRLAVEMDGCVIDTSTILEENLIAE